MQNGCESHGYFSSGELNEREKRQSGNQGGRTITSRLNHKEVIFLLCLDGDQAGEVFAVL